MYNKIIVDVFNVYHRIAAFASEGSSVDIPELYKLTIQRLLDSTFGEVYLLFDPLRPNLKISQRASVLEDYKKNRKSKDYKDKLEHLNKLYKDLVLYPKPRLHIYQNLNYEADDFVEKLTADGKCLLITSDMDWARYLEFGRVDMMTKGLKISDDHIYTAQDFKANPKHPFYPTIPSVTFWKALYGDDTDGIPDRVKGLKNVIDDKNIIILRDAEKELKNTLAYMGDHPAPLIYYKTLFFQGKGIFETFHKLLNLSCTPQSFQKFFRMVDTNFSVIESYLPLDSDIDITQFEAKLDLNLQAPKIRSLGKNK